MKKTYLIAAMLLSGATLANAQNDDDWQIGGGRATDQNTTTQQYQRNNYELESPMQPRSMGLFNGGYEESPLSFNLGYVNKVWKTKYGNETVSENFFGEEGKRLHGFGFGVLYQPCFNFGLGLRTGINLEVYISNSSYVKDQKFDDFTELDLYIPLQACYRIPLSYKASLTLFGGLGFNVACHGQYTEHNRVYDLITDQWYDDSYHETQPYGKNGWPKRCNWSAEFGGTVRYSDFNFSFTYSRGLTKHEVGDALNTSRQDKLNFTIGYLLPL